LLSLLILTYTHKKTTNKPSQSNRTKTKPQQAIATMMTSSTTKPTSSNGQFGSNATKRTAAVAATSLVLLIASTLLMGTDAFQYSGQDVALKMPPSGGQQHQQQQQESGKKVVQLDFEGTYETSSETIPNVSGNDIMSFFQDTEHRDLLLKGGDNPTDTFATTPELLQLWRKQSEIVNTTPPLPTDPIVAIKSSVNLLPGLKITAVSYMGCKFLQDPVTSLPVYEFTLVFDEYVASGMRPLVWIFNQLTGEDNPRDSESSRFTSAVSRITMVASDAASSTGSVNGGKSKNGNNESSSRWASFLPKRARLPRNGRPTDNANGNNADVSMEYYGLVRVSCSIPKRLLQILPFSKQKVQEKVSKAMSGQLQREGTKSMEKVQAALVDWVQKRQQEQEPQRQKKKLQYISL